MIYLLSVLTLAGWFATMSPEAVQTSVQIPSKVSAAEAPAEMAVNVIVSAVNKTQAPLVEERKLALIPDGYVYVRHTLELRSAFPHEGASTEGDSYIVGPDQRWVISANLVKNSQQRVTGVSATVQANAGRKNEEIGAEALLTVYFRKQS